MIKFPKYSAAEYFLEAFNRKYLGIRKRDGRIKKRELTILEKRLLKLGWKDLRWGPHEGKEIRWTLYGCPPNYDGEFEDYTEAVIHTLAIPGQPGDDSGYILVRKILNKQWD
jgi:hypothetical protein|tara:strand:+ start:6553 stop:6888 length:336 start_codon:yes stop_codon:yes gene_type:complete